MLTEFVQKKLQPVDLIVNAPSQQQEWAKGETQPASQKAWQRLSPDREKEQSVGFNFEINFIYTQVVV